MTRAILKTSGETHKAQKYGLSLGEIEWVR